MKHFIKFILILLLSCISSLILPFWGVAIAAFLVSLMIGTSGTSSFFIGLLALFLLWSIMAFMNDFQTGGIMTDRISQLLSVDPPVLLLITGLLGGLTGALGSLTGCYFRQLFTRP